MNKGFFYFFRIGALFFFFFFSWTSSFKCSENNNRKIGITFLYWFTYSTNSWWCANFPLFFSLICSIANTKLTPESPTRWEGSRISIAKSNSSFVVSTFPGVEEKTGNFSCSLLDGSRSGDVDLTCSVRKRRAESSRDEGQSWHVTHTAVHGPHGPSASFSSLFHAIGQTLPRYLWRIKQLHMQQFLLHVAEEGVC